MTDDPKDPHASWDDIIADQFRHALMAPLPLIVHSPAGSFASALRAALEHLECRRVVFDPMMPSTPRMRIESSPDGPLVALHPVWRQLVESTAAGLGADMTIDGGEVTFE